MGQIVEVAVVMDQMQFRGILISVDAVLGALMMWALIWPFSSVFGLRIAILWYVIWRTE